MALLIAFKDRLFPDRSEPTTSASGAHNEASTPAREQPQGSAVVATQPEPAPTAQAPSQPASPPVVPPILEPTPEPEETPALGVRDGITGENLTLDPLPHMQEPRTAHSVLSALEGLKRLNAGTYYGRWAEAYFEALKARLAWQHALPKSEIVILREEAEAQLATYLVMAAAAEKWRAAFYREAGAKPPPR